MLDVAIVGAGFGGMYMLHRLRGLGMRARVLEAGSDVGGTWYWNRYPGARCDVESMQYSYQFSDALQQEWQWTERYAPQPEILRYARHVAERFDLRRDIQFDTRVAAAAFDEGSGRWRLTTDDGAVIEATWCVMATGCLSAPNLPDFEGRDRFEGPTYLTGRWPHEEVDFTGRRVAVIGTGSSAIQSIPVIARQAAHLTVFQRTANYAVPARNRPLEPEAVRAIKADYASLRARAWQKPTGIDFDYRRQSALEVAPAERQREFEARWQQGGLCFMAAFRDLLLSHEANAAAADFVRAKIQGIVHDPALAAKLTPKNIIGAKRLCVDTGYYATFNRPNVTLVDLDERAASCDHARRRARPGPHLPGRRDRLRHRLRCDDRRPAADRHSRSRRRAAARRLGKRPAQLSGPAGRRLPQPVHHHRAGQPVGADQHAALDRAARELDRRLPGPPARAQRHLHRGERGLPRMPGWPMSKRPRTRRSRAPPAPGMSAPTSPASRRCSCPTSAAFPPISRNATRSSPTATRAFCWAEATYPPVCRNSAWISKITSSPIAGA